MHFQPQCFTKIILFSLSTSWVLVSNGYATDVWKTYFWRICLCHLPMVIMYFFIFLGLKKIRAKENLFFAYSVKQHFPKVTLKAWTELLGSMFFQLWRYTSKQLFVYIVDIWHLPWWALWQPAHFLPSWERHSFPQVLRMVAADGLSLNPSLGIAFSWTKLLCSAHAHSQDRAYVNDWPKSQLKSTHVPQGGTTQKDYSNSRNSLCNGMRPWVQVHCNSAPFVSFIHSLCLPTAIDH